jgi:hypothetical protein
MFDELRRKKEGGEGQGTKPTVTLSSYVCLDLETRGERQYAGRSQNV